MSFSGQVLVGRIDGNAKHHGKRSQLRRLASGLSGIVWSGHSCVAVILSRSCAFEWTEGINQLRTSVFVVPNPHAFLPAHHQHDCPTTPFGSRW